MSAAPARQSATLMLLDTYGLVYRAFFAMPPLSTSAGLSINAALGFVNMLARLIATENPTHLIAAFDKGMPAARVALYPQYKAQRSTMPEELRPQFALVRRILHAYNVPIAEIEGQEADDVIATLAHRAYDADQQVTIVTGDLDLLQIVDDRTTVLRTKRGITDLERFDPAAVRERFALEPAQLVDYRGLKGDPSDNLPGVPGVGEKTASKLIQVAGSLDNLLAHPELAGTPKLQALIETYGAQAAVCRDVSIIRRDLDVALDWDAARYVPPDNDALYHLYSELEFKGLLAKLQPPSDMPLFAAPPAVRGTYRSFVAAVDPPEFEELAQALRALGRGERAALVAGDDTIGISGESGTGISLGAAALAHANVRAAFETLWNGPTRVSAYDAKKVSRALARHGLPIRPVDDDPMLAAHLLDPGASFVSIDATARAHLGIAAGEDPAAQADAAFQLLRPLRTELAARDQIGLYEEVEVPLAPLLAKMERVGIAIDPSELATLAVEIDAAIARLQQHIFDFAGETFNIGSPLQLGNVLFGRLQIPGGKKNKTGWATGVEVLAGLAREYPICALVLEWREVTKLKNTYVDVIPTLVDADGRLRTEFNQTATATGRLSSTNPNLQNVPVRGELGRRIRRAFVARDAEHVLLAADYSQIELRIMAHLSGDEAMRRAFEEGQDIHDFTARQIFNVPAGSQVDGNQRRMAKSVNFGLLYGMSDFGLAQRLEIGRAEAKEITVAYFARFPSVRAYIERTLEEARVNGYVATILGRRRYMPGLTSGNYMLRAAAEREATNAPLQGSAADLMKLAMVRADREIEKTGLDASMLLQIHDELIFEVPRAQLHATAHAVRDAMEGAMTLSVPLEVTMKTGANWYDVKPLDDV
ncbi:MAG TPA: DNA polymerase I [Candidatus Baltobacteraceae bacterium]